MHGPQARTQARAEASADLLISPKVVEVGSSRRELIKEEPRPGAPKVSWSSPNVAHVESHHVESHHKERNLISGYQHALVGERAVLSAETLHGLGVWINDPVLRRLEAALGPELATQVSLQLQGAVGKDLRRESGG